MTTDSHEINRPKWIELLRLQTTSARNEAAARLFGYRPPRPGESPQPYDAREFKARFGIDIGRYSNFFAEVAQANAPTGPCTPATNRIPIKPILAIRQRKDRTYEVEGLQLTRGFFNQEKTRAWVLVDDFMELMGDPYFDEMEQELQRERERLMEKVRVLRDSNLTEEEQQVFTKVRDGAQFEDLSEDERRTIANIMQRLDQDQK